MKNSRTTAETLLGKIAELEPLLVEHRDQSEREARLAAPVIEALRDAGFFRMFRPLALGGFEADPVTAYRVLEALARIDSAAGWNVAISNASELFGAYLGEEGSERIFGQPDAVLAGAFFPHRRAVAVDGGYRLSGRTNFNSNCQAATWHCGLADVYDGDTARLDETGAPKTILVFFPADQAHIIDNWDTLGMRATGSHDVEVEDLFVPESQTATFGPLDRPGPAYRGPLHHMLTWSAVTCNAAPALGIAGAAIDGLVELGIKVPAYTGKALRNRGDVQVRLAAAAGKVAAARSFLHQTYTEAWSTASRGSDLAMSQRAQCQLAAVHAVTASAEAVDLVHACVGTTGIRNGSLFQRHLRDIHVITQHAYVCAGRLDSVGQVMFELEPDWPFLHLP